MNRIDPEQPQFETAKGVFRVTLPNRNEEGTVDDKGIYYSAEKTVRPSMVEEKRRITEYARANGSITRKETETLIGSGTTKAFRLLKELCDSNELEKKGEGRLSTYVLK